MPPPRRHGSNTAYEFGYIDVGPSTLAYTEQYDWSISVSDRTRYSEEEWAEYLSLGVPFFVEDGRKGNPDPTAEAAGNAIFGSYINIVKNASQLYDDPFNAPHILGARDLWSSFSASDRAGKTPLISPNTASQAQNDSLFRDIYIEPDYINNPVYLVMTESGVAYRDSNGEDFAERPGWGYYYFLYVPDGDAGGGATPSNINVTYRPGRLTLPQPRSYPDGTLRYTDLDPVNVVFGDFVWQYPDLTIGGKHDLAFTRVYDNQAQVVGALGNKWSTSFSYKLEADSTNAYFTLPNGEGVPFQFNSETGYFQPLDASHTDYALGYSDGGGYIYGSNDPIATQSASAQMSGFTLRGFIGPKQDEAVGLTEASLELEEDHYISNDEDSTGNYFDEENFITEDIASSSGSAVRAFSSGNEFSDAGSPFREDNSVNGDIFPDEDISSDEHETPDENASDVSVALSSVNKIQRDGDSADITEYTYTASDGAEYVMTMEKISYQTISEPLRPARALRAVPAYTFDPAGKSYVIKAKDGESWYFDENLRVTRVERDGALKYSYSYNSNGEISRVTGRYGAYFDFAYNSNGLIASVSDYAGNTVKFIYDGANQLVESVNPDGNSLRYFYDSNGNITSIRDFTGTEYIRNVYDDKDRVIEQTVIDRGVYRAVYDDGLLANTFIDPLGNQTKYYYDSNNMVIKVEAAGSNTLNEFVSGRVVKQTDKLNRLTLYFYDEIGRQTQIAYPDGTKRKIIYDGRNNPIEETRENAAGTVVSRVSIVYDAENNPIEITDANGAKIYNTYRGCKRKRRQANCCK